MNLSRTGILLLSTEKTEKVIQLALKDLPGIEIRSVENDRAALESMDLHNPALIIVEDPCKRADMKAFCIGLLSRKALKDLPLLIITGSKRIEGLMTDFKGLLFDFLTRPLKTPLIQARVRFFLELHKQREAVDQSLRELDNIYQKLMNRDNLIPDDLVQKASVRILCIEPSGEDFDIFAHFLRNEARYLVFRAQSIEEALKTVSEKQIDLLFINPALTGGSGLDLMDRLHRLRLNIPVIFILDRNRRHEGPQALSRGAWAWVSKENLSGRAVLSITNRSLYQAKILQEAEDSRTRIIALSRRDSLTKLPNRESFEQTLESEIARSGRYDTPLSVLIVDLDDFSSVNARYGYETGDRLLAACAVRIQALVRASDTLCRVGGDEFGLVLPETGLDGARLLAGRIRARIAGQGFGLHEEEISLTASIGAAACEAGSTRTCHGLVENALKALKQTSGRGK